MAQQHTPGQIGALLGNYSFRGAGESLFHRSTPETALGMGNILLAKYAQDMLVGWGVGSMLTPNFSRCEIRWAFQCD